MTFFHAKIIKYKFFYRMVRAKCHIAPDFSLFKAFHHAPRPIKSEAIWYGRLLAIFDLWSKGIVPGNSSRGK